MKNILITGANSYIGTSLERWMKKDIIHHYQVNTIDMRNDSWEEQSFSKYDVIIHVAGIAHVPSNSKLDDLYYEVNCNLAVKTAHKAKTEGARQFIFMSSIIVYGKISVIDINTVPIPTNAYGMSKLQAEEGIKSLEDEKFKVVILRLPMIYGKNSKGNYAKLTSFAKRTLIFPRVHNQRSMLYIDDLCELIKLLIDHEENGMYYPQNADYTCTSLMIQKIAELNKRRIWFIKMPSSILKLLLNKCQVFNKVFGDLYYEKNMSSYKYNYQITSFEESIVKSAFE